MDFSISTLLANFTNDKLVAVKLLEKKLNCQDETSLAKLHIALEVLEKVGVLVKDRGKYRRVIEEDVIEAKLRCSSKGFCFAIQAGEGAEDIYIRESHLSNAWNGDRVLVKLTKEGSRRRSPEGEVQLILERANKSLLARIKQTNASFRAVPLDDRLLFEIDLQKNEANLAEADNHLVHVEILRYQLGQYPPIGRVVQVLGSDAEAASDVDLVCCKHDIPRNFPDAVLAAAAGLPSRISKVDLKKRLDLRSLLTITIDDLVENAFSLEKTDTGQRRLGVHIADVAHYVPAEEPVDWEALKRGRSVYLGETVLPLLPSSLIKHCSLLPRSERLAISILITLDLATGQISEFEIQPTVIQVDAQLSEQDIRTILFTQEGKIPQNLPAEVVELVTELSALSQAVQAQRQQRGGFELKLPQRESPFYDEGMLGAIVAAGSSTPATQSSLAKLVLTQLIILANQVIAEHLRAIGVPAIYRVQPAPEVEDVQEMIKLANSLGVELRLEEEESVQPQDYLRFTQQFAILPDSEKVLTYLLLATLKNAVYSTVAGHHFGLALESGYTHCNSPLRRYPDLLIQRVLQAVFEQGRDRRTTRAKDRVNLRHSSAHGSINWNVLPPELHQELEIDLAKVIVQLNDREKEVQDAEEDLAGLQKAQLMKQRTGEIFQGLITGVQSYGFFVEIEVPANDGRLLRVEGLVHVSSLKDDWYEYRARQQALFGRKNRAAYRLGDQVAVQVKSVDYYRQQIDLITVNGSIEVDTSQDHDHLDEDMVELDFDPVEQVQLSDAELYSRDEE